MASEEEKKDIISLTEEPYNQVEWPWNKLSISIRRKTAQEMGNRENTLGVVKIMVFFQLIIEELVEVHGSQGYYDSQDGGKLSAVLLVTDNFIQNPKKETAISLNNLIENLDKDMYVPDLSKCEYLKNNIYNDILSIRHFLDEWCLENED